MIVKYAIPSTQPVKLLFPVRSIKIPYQASYLMQSIGVWNVTWFWQLCSSLQTCYNCPNCCKPGNLFLNEEYLLRFRIKPVLLQNSDFHLRSFSIRNIYRQLIFSIYYPTTNNCESRIRDEPSSQGFRSFPCLYLSFHHPFSFAL